MRDRRRLTGDAFVLCVKLNQPRIRAAQRTQHKARGFNNRLCCDRIKFHIKVLLLKEQTEQTQRSILPTPTSNNVQRGCLL